MGKGGRRMHCINKSAGGFVTGKGKAVASASHPTSMHKGA